MMVTKTCLGVDISGGDMKLVELRRSRSGLEVLQAVRVKLGNKSVGSELKQFLAETNTFPSSAVWSVPACECSIKFASLPKTKATETARMARYEAETQIPLPLSDLMWGYGIQRPREGEDLSHLILGAVRRELIDTTLNSLEESRLPLEHALISSLAGAKSVCRYLGDRGDAAFVVEIGDEWTDLTAVDNDRVTASRNLHIGLNGLVAGIAADKHVDEAEAGRIVRDSSSKGLLPGGIGENPSSMEWVEGLCLEIRRSILSSMSVQDGKTIGLVVLAGEGAGISGLDQAVSTRINLPVEIANPWKGMSISSAAQYGGGDDPSVYSVATGLALACLERATDIDLMPSERAEERAKQRQRRAILTGLSTGVIALLIVLLLGYSGIRAKSEELGDLQASAKAARSQVHMLGRNVSATVTTMRKVSSALEDRKDSPIDTLQRLSQGLPKSCWLTEFRYDAGKSIVLRGNALSNSAVADAVYTLSNTGEFSNVSLDYSNLSRTANSEVYDFQIKCDLPSRDALQALSKNPSRAKSRKDGLIAK